LLQVAPQKPASTSETLVCRPDISRKPRPAYSTGRLNRDTIFNSCDLSLNLAQKSVRGGMTTMSAQIIQFVLRALGVVVLARLLTPDDYGLIGMVTVVVGFAELFKDCGLSMATIQKDRISHEQISTLFWINILISVFLGICILTISPLIAAFYRRPELKAVTAALSLSFIISGLMIQHQALLRRHMQFGSLAIIQIISQIITIAVTILLAFLGWRYWALVGGTLAASLSGTLMTLFFCPWIPGRMQKGTGVREMLKFGSHLTGFNFVNYFARNADNVLIGRYIGADALGFYSKAYQLFMMPITQVRWPIVNVVMPVFSSLKGQPERYAKYYQRLVDIMVSVTVPLTIYCVIEADFVILSLLGKQWQAAVPVFRILAIAGLLQSISGTAGMVQVSLGFSERYFKWGVISAILFVSSFIIGIPFGIEGVATAYVIANGVNFFPTLFYCFRKSPVTVTLVLKTVFVPIFISLAAGACAGLTRHIIGYDSVGEHFMVLAVFVITVFIGYSFRKSTHETIRMFLENSPLQIYKKSGALRPSTL
jgi:O-antigen/teichoic acid export membrane protein